MVFGRNSFIQDSAQVVADCRLAYGKAISITLGNSSWCEGHKLSLEMDV